MSYLESSSEAVDTVVCLLLRKTFEGEENSLGFFGDQIIGSAKRRSLAKLHIDQITTIMIREIQPNAASYDLVGASIPQAQLPVPGRVDIPIGDWLQHLREPWSLQDVRRK